MKYVITFCLVTRLFTTSHIVVENGKAINKHIEYGSTVTDCNHIEQFTTLKDAYRFQHSLYTNRDYLSQYYTNVKIDSVK